MAMFANRSGHIQIGGFLLQANIFTGRDIIKQHFVVEYKTKV
jgi:hypothetical protein